MSILTATGIDHDDIVARLESGDVVRRAVVSLARRRQDLAAEIAAELAAADRPDAAAQLLEIAQKGARS